MAIPDTNLVFAFNAVILALLQVVLVIVLKALHEVKHLATV